MQLDHVILGVTDLEAAAARLADHHRLTAVPGGRHEAAGTLNWIVPLDDAYIELIAVEDPETASANAFGRWVQQGATAAGAWLGWVLRTDDLDAVCARIGTDPHAMTRGPLRWRMAGFQRTLRDPSLPFFIQWDVPETELPGRAGGPTQASDARLTAVSVGADAHTLEHWVGAGELPGTIRLEDGPRGVHAVTVAGAGGVEVVRGL